LLIAIVLSSVIAALIYYLNVNTNVPEDHYEIDGIHVERPV